MPSRVDLWSCGKTHKRIGRGGKEEGKRSVCRSFGWLVVRLSRQRGRQAHTVMRCLLDPRMARRTYEFDYWTGEVEDPGGSWLCRTWWLARSLPQAPHSAHCTREERKEKRNDRRATKSELVGKKLWNWLLLLLLLLVVVLDCLPASVLLSLTTYPTINLSITPQRD